jgi:hypothetical protein
LRTLPAHRAETSPRPRALLKPAQIAQPMDGQSAGVVLPPLGQSLDVPRNVTTRLSVEIVSGHPAIDVDRPGERLGNFELRHTDQRRRTIPVPCRDATASRRVANGLGPPPEPASRSKVIGEILEELLCRLRTIGTRTGSFRRPYLLPFPCCSRSSASRLSAIAGMIPRSRRRSRRAIRPRGRPYGMPVRSFRRPNQSSQSSQISPRLRNQPIIRPLNRRRGDDDDANQAQRPASVVEDSS